MRLDELYIVTSYKCNLRCRFCFQKEYRGHELYITREAIENLLESILRTPPVQVTVMGGETSLDPDLLFSILDKTRRCERVAVVTNGTLLIDPDRLRSYPNVSLSISYDREHVLQTGDDRISTNIEIYKSRDIPVVVHSVVGSLRDALWYLKTRRILTSRGIQTSHSIDFYRGWVIRLILTLLVGREEMLDSGVCGYGIDSACLNLVDGRLYSCCDSYSESEVVDEDSLVCRLVELDRTCYRIHYLSRPLSERLLSEVHICRLHNQISTGSRWIVPLSDILFYRRRRRTCSDSRI